MSRAIEETAQMDTHPVSEPHAETDAMTDAAWEVYNERLKGILETEFVGQVVAIHPASGDYEVAQCSPQAWKPLRQRHPGELIAVIDIGIVSEDNALSLRASGLLQRSKRIG